MDQVEISNASLTLIGAKQIISPDEDLAVKAMWPLARDTTLIDHTWKFAHEIKELAQLSQEPDTAAWSYMYQIPNDCLYPRRMDDESTEYEIIGGAIYTNESSRILHYTKSVENPELYPVHFVNVLAYRLASMIATRKTGSKSSNLPKLMLEIYNLELPQAIAVDQSQENISMRGSEEEDSFISARK